MLRNNLHEKDKKKCREGREWLPPGKPSVKVGGKRVTVTVRGGETVEVGSCE